MSKLELRDINSYYGQSHILFDLSLSVNDGEFVTLLGRNGAGKTTTLRSIMGLVDTLTGEVRHDGENIVGLSPHEVSKRGISFIPEERRIFSSLTVEENLLTGYIGHDIPNSHEEVLEPIFEYFPKLEELRGKNAGQLSGGEQQMVATARGLVSDPDVILIDEPTEGIMPTLVESFKEDLRQINKDGVTVLLVEQNAEVAFDLSDRLYIIDEGTVKLDGTAEALRGREDIQQQYLAI